MRYRLNVMIFVGLILAMSNLLLLGVGSASGETGSITGTIFYDVQDLNPIIRGDVVILEANRGLEVARVQVVDSSFGPIQVPVGSYRIVFDSLAAGYAESFPPVFFQILTPHVSPMQPLYV